MQFKVKRPYFTLFKFKLTCISAYICTAIFYPYINTASAVIVPGCHRHIKGQIFIKYIYQWTPVILCLELNTHTTVDRTYKNRILLLIIVPFKTEILRCRCPVSKPVHKACTILVYVKIK